MRAPYFSLTIWFWVSLVIFPTSTYAACYLPGAKTAAKDQAYQPCSNNPDDPMSNVCCGTNRTNPYGGKLKDGTTAERCLPNGLCMSHYEGDDGTQVYEYFREYCSDINGWENGNCLNICRHGDTGWAPMTPCNGSSTSERWVCDGRNTEGCIPEVASAKDIEVWTIAAKFLGSASTLAATAATSAPTSESSTTSAPTTSPTPSASSSSTSNPASPSQPESTSASASLSTSAKAGIGIGAAVGGLGLLGVGAWLMKAHTRRSDAKAREQVDAELPGMCYSYKHEELPPPGRFLEARADRDAEEVSGEGLKREARELYGEVVVSELPGSEGERNASHYLES